MYTGVLSDRVTGNTGISIGTHLALETFFLNKKLEAYDVEREVKVGDINEYQFHIYNIYTILRNILNSFKESDKATIITHKDFYNVVKDELQAISLLYYDTKCKPVIFAPDYTKIYTGYNVGKETGITTVYKEHMLITNVIKNLHLKHGIESINKFKGYKIPVLDKNTKTNYLITTNIPLDMFNKLHLTLLESHTGKLKSKDMLNTKYHSIGKLELTHLPYMEELMFLLGDKTLVTPTSLLVRRTIHQVSIDKNWTIKTTRDKVRDNLLKVPEIASILKLFKLMY